MVDSSFRVGVAQRVLSSVNYDAKKKGASAKISWPLSAGSDPQADPPGWCLPYNAKNPSSKGQTYPHYHERGHLIGKQFGGSGAANNLVTMTTATNGSEHLTEESKIVKHLKGDKKRTVDYKVTPDYTPFSYQHSNGDVYIEDPAPYKIGLSAVDDLGAVVVNTTINNGVLYGGQLK